MSLSLCQVRCPSFSSVKTRQCKRLNAEADMKVQLPPIKTDVKGYLESIKQYQSTHFLLFLKIYVDERTYLY
jgi:hypothetical protein